MPRRALLALAALALLPQARAAEHITLRNGMEMDCARHESTGDRVRLYLLPAAGSAQLAPESSNYIEVSATAILRTETIPDPPPPAAKPSAPHPLLSTPSLPELLTRAGASQNIDVDLLAAVVHAESNGNVRAVSRAGARGLMQLMPATANELNVQDSFAPDQNIGGGTAYLDQLLTRYHDNIALALAAYNAGPAAVDRYHGIPPYAETRAYVARVIREFNRRKLASAAPSQLAVK
jgi:soluble lytic murein transglycosylase-like protein